MASIFVLPPLILPHCRARSPRLDNRRPLLSLPQSARPQKEVQIGGDHRIHQRQPRILCLRTASLDESISTFGRPMPTVDPDSINDGVDFTCLGDFPCKDHRIQSSSVGLRSVHFSGLLVYNRAFTGACTRRPQVTLRMSSSMTT